MLLPGTKFKAPAVVYLTRLSPGDGRDHEDVVVLDLATSGWWVQLETHTGPETGILRLYT